METKDYRRVLYKKTDFDEIFDQNYLKKFFKGIKKQSSN